MSDYDEFAEQVQRFCRMKLEGDPAASDEELFAAALEEWPSLEAISLRQFRVRHALPAKREMAREDLEAAVGGRVTVGEFRTNPPGEQTEDEEPTQREMFAREDGGR